MLAYFIGGPWDLTKRQLADDQPHYQVASWEPFGAVYYDTPGRPVDVPISTRTHTYTRAGKIADDVVIYISKELRR